MSEPGEPGRSDPARSLTVSRSRKSPAGRHGGRLSRAPAAAVSPRRAQGHLGRPRQRPASRTRFQRESSIAAQIEHPNVIPVYAIGEAGNILYIAMRFVEGTDLRRVMAGEPLEPRRAARIVDQVAQALDAAHAHGLVHRDVKPANILISEAGGREHVYLSDFGLSRHIDGSQELTSTGAFLGTIDYVAPEQARGERVDARTDVYSLGCVLFQALTGTVPYPLDNDLAKLYAHDSKPPPSALDRAPHLPRAFESVLQRALAKAPEDRYLSAGDLGKAALAAASDESLSRAERNVAFGAAAPATAEAVTAPATRPRGALTPPDTPPGATDADLPRAAATITPARPGNRRGLALAAIAAAAAVIAALVFVPTSGGDDSPEKAKAPDETVAADATNAADALEVVPGRSIGTIFLGEDRDALLADVRGSGFTPEPGDNANETRIASSGRAHGVVRFFGDRATYIRIAGAPEVKINGISVDSTLGEAQAALRDWRISPCASGSTYLIAPDGHTYFEFSGDPNAADENGLVITADTVAKCTDGRTVVPGGAERTIVNFVARETGFRAKDMRCPSGVTAAVGVIFDCRFTGPEGPYVAHVRVREVTGPKILFAIDTERSG